MRIGFILILIVFRFSNLQGFVPNKGQWDEHIIAKAEYASSVLFLEKNTFTFHFINPEFFKHLHEHNGNNKTIEHVAFKLIFSGSNPDPQITYSNKSANTYNYFKGKASKNWQGGIHAYQKITYHNIYPNIDLVVYHQQQNLKYDFMIKPGGDLNDIQIAYSGIQPILQDNKSVISLPWGQLYEHIPLCITKGVNGHTDSISCNYRISKEYISFSLPKSYSPSHSDTIVIDPELIFSTFSGSYANNFGYTATFDNSGFLYSGSTAFDIGYPTTVGSWDETFNGGNVDIAISKYDTTGTQLIYSTYIGGSNDELPHSLIVNENDELYILGTSGSSDFPYTANAYDSTFNGGPAVNLQNGLGVNFSDGVDIVVTKLSSDGSQLLGSTFLGGSHTDGLNTASAIKYNYADEVRGEIMIDQTGNIYVSSCTRSSDFPVTTGVFQPNIGGTEDGCIIKINPNLSQIIWSSYIGGTLNDATYAIDVATDNSIYVCGGSESTDFPTTSGTLNSSFLGGRSDGFIANIDSNGNKINAATYWGSIEYDQIYFIELDQYNNVYIYGQTEESGSALITNASYASSGGGQFVSKLSKTLSSITWSSAFGTGGGSPNLSPTAFLVDYCGRIYISGWGGAVNQYTGLNNNAGYTNGMDVTGGAYQSTTDGSDFYLAVLENDASSLVYATFFGGPQSTEHVDGGTSRFDRKGRVYQSVCAGCGGYSDFPIYPASGAVSATNNNSCNNAVFKFDFNIPVTVADYYMPASACAPATIDFSNTSLVQGITTYLWDFGNGDTSSSFGPTYTFSNPGDYKVKLLVTDSGSCNITDSIIKSIVIQTDTTYTLPDTSICLGNSIQIGIAFDSGYTYSWSTSVFLNDSTVSNPLSTPDSLVNYTLYADNGICIDTIFQKVDVIEIFLNVENMLALCYGIDSAITLSSSSLGTAKDFFWSSSNNFTDTLNTSLLDSTIVLNIDSDSYTSYYYIKTTNYSTGCELIDSILVLLSGQEFILEPSTSLCINDTIQINAINPNAIDTFSYDYYWEPDSLIIGETNQSAAYVSPSQAATIVMKATNALGCKSTDSILVEVSDLSQNNINIYAQNDTIYKGQSTAIYVEPTGYAYTWNPETGLSSSISANPLASPESSITYQVTIYDPTLLGCSIDTSISIFVYELICDEPYIFVPSAFSPNHDNENDVLYVRSSVIDKNDLYFTVYNRWGEMVFESFDLDYGWDGIYKDVEVDPDVFVYYLTAKCLDGQDFFKKGNVTLIK